MKSVVIITYGERAAIGLIVDVLTGQPPNFSFLIKQGTTDILNSLTKFQVCRKNSTAQKIPALITNFTIAVIVLNTSSPNGEVQTK